MKKITTSTKTVNVAELSIHPFLKKYGVSKILKFEIEQHRKFSLKPGMPIITEDKSVIHDWDAVDTANKMQMKTIDCMVVEGIDEEEVIQIASLKNLRRRLSRFQIAELVAELKDYMTLSPIGRQWKEEVPGKNVIEKIGFLLNYSYGMISNTQKIYKYNPDLLKRIDEGEMTFTQALAQATPPKAVEMENEEDSVESPKDQNPDERSDDVNEVEMDDEETDDESSDEGPIGSSSNSTKPRSWRYAGEKQMVPCERIAGIQIIYESGRKVDYNINGEQAEAVINGRQCEGLTYSGGLFHPRDASEIHVIASERYDRGIEIICWNIENQAA